MTTLRRNCFLASTGCHALLLLTVVGAAALVPPPSPLPENLPVVTIIREVVDEPVAPGGAAPAPAQPPPSQPPEPKPKPKPTPRPPAPKPKPAPARVESPPPAVDARPEPDDSAKEPAKPKRPPIKPNLKVVTRSSAEPEAPTRDEPPSTSSAERERLDQIISEIQSRPATVKDPVPGLGSGSAADYRLYVKSVYQRAWTPPPEIDDDTATVTIRVVIARDGTVRSARITKRSGNAALDRSVETAMQRVTRLKPFPTGATESEREYDIDYNLKTRRASLI